jgi:hypothetical protein
MKQLLQISGLARLVGAIDGEVDGALERFSLEDDGGVVRDLDPLDNEAARQNIDGLHESGVEASSVLLSFSFNFPFHFLSSLFFVLFWFCFGFGFGFRSGAFSGG